MSVEHMKATGTRWINELWNNGNLSVIDELTTPNYIDHGVPPGMPDDREGFKQFVIAYRTAFPDLSLTVEDMFAEGDRVATRWTARGTNNGPMFGIPATGKPAVIKGINITRFEGDKLAEGWNNFDSLGLMQQLGLAPAPGA